MRYEIDQSGKIEDTAKDTILCISNDEWYTVKILAKTKRQIQETFRRHGQIRNFVLFAFSAGLVSLLKRIPRGGNVTIDEEYMGKSFAIKNIALEMLSVTKPVPDLHFGHIGKQSHAHVLAKEVALGHQKPTLVIDVKKILSEIKKTEVGKRLKDA